MNKKIKSLVRWTVADMISWYDDLINLSDQAVYERGFEDQTMYRESCKALKQRARLIRDNRRFIDSVVTGKPYKVMS